MTNKRQCLDCKEKYGYTDEPTLNCEVSGHKLVTLNEQIEVKRSGRVVIDPDKPFKLRHVLDGFDPGRPKAPDDMMTIQDASKLWGITVSRLKHMCSNGEILGAQRIQTSPTNPRWYIPRSAARPNIAQHPLGRPRKE